MLATLRSVLDTVLGTLCSVLDTLGSVSVTLSNVLSTLSSARKVRAREGPVSVPVQRDKRLPITMGL